MTEAYRKTLPKPRELPRSASSIPEPVEPLPLPIFPRGTLPGRVPAAWDWQRLAACRGKDVNLFYGKGNENKNERNERKKQAKAICNPCPVKAQCLELAIRTDEPAGIWGGKTRAERVALSWKGTWTT
jgi:hypothetical protein